MEAGRLVLIDGDPTKNISDVRKVALTIKDGVIYDSAELCRDGDRAALIGPSSEHAPAKGDERRLGRVAG